MKIKIEAPLKPFSHLPGTKCLLPGTNCVIQAFPARICLSGKVIWDLPFTGPIEGFTIEQDIERGRVAVFGKAKEGFYRFYLKASEKGIVVVIDKLPIPTIAYEHSSFQVKEQFVIPLECDTLSTQCLEKISFGKHKSQDWDLVLRRFDLKEIIPFAFALGQKTPGQGIGFAERELKPFFQAAFSSMLVPRMFDDSYQGLNIGSVSEGDPLQKAFHWIRSLFFQQQGNVVTLLPEVPKFDCGRMIHLQLVDIGELDFEWASFHLTRAVIRPKVSGEFHLICPKDVKSFRVRRFLHEKGKKHIALDPFTLEKDQTIYLDRFFI